MANPLLTEERWHKLADLERAPSTTMTMDGALNKTLLLIGVLLLTISGMWAYFWKGQITNPQVLMPWMIGGAIGGLVLCLVHMFAVRSTPIIAPLYAICKGIFLGAITMIYHQQWQGLPLLAAVITIGITLGCVILYRSGVVRVSGTFVKAVVGATVGVFFAIAGLWLLSIFGIGGGVMQALYGSGPIGIGFSVVMVGLATFNIIVDLKLIEDGAQARAPKWMEWVGAFGLLVTIVWLYIEILRLLAKLRGRD